MNWIKQHWFLILLIALLVYAISTAQKAIITGVAVIATIASVLRYAVVWPLALIAWLLHFLWGTDTLRGWFGKPPLNLLPVKPNITGGQIENSAD